MRSPFDDLGKPRVENPEGEEVGGTFFCQERGCYEVVRIARYIGEAQVLTWKCKNDHISKMEDFEFDG